MFKKDFGQLYLSFFIGALLIVFASTGFCDVIHVFDVHNNLQMSPNDPVYRDYYISGGKDEGLKVGMVVPVVRNLSIHDPLYNVDRGDLTVKVGSLKVIQVADRMSVCRQVGSVDLATVPMTDFYGIMIGDTLDIANASMDSKGASLDNGSNKNAGVAATNAAPSQAPTTTASAQAAVPAAEAQAPQTPVQAQPDPQAQAIEPKPNRKIASRHRVKIKRARPHVSPQRQEGQDKPVPIIGEVPGIPAVN